MLIRLIHVDNSNHFKHSLVQISQEIPKHTQVNPKQPCPQIAHVYGNQHASRINSAWYLVELKNAAIVSYLLFAVVLLLVVIQPDC